MAGKWSRRFGVGLIKLQMKFTKKNVAVYLWNKFLLETLHFSLTAQTTT